MQLTVISKWLYSYTQVKDANNVKEKKNISSLSLELAYFVGDEEGRFAVGVELEEEVGRTVVVGLAVLEVGRRVEGIMDSVGRTVGLAERTVG